MRKIKTEILSNRYANNKQSLRVGCFRKYVSGVAAQNGTGHAEVVLYSDHNGTLAQCSEDHIEGP